MVAVTYVELVWKIIPTPCGIVTLQGLYGKMMSVLILFELRNFLPLQTLFNSCVRMVLLICLLGLLWLHGAYGSDIIGYEWDNLHGR